MRRGVQKGRETYAPCEMVVIVYTIGLESIHGSVIRGFAAVVCSYKEGEESVFCFPFKSSRQAQITVPVPQESMRPILSLRFGCLARF